MVYGMRAQVVLPLLFSILILGILGIEEAWAPTKISPSHAEPGERFTIIDAPDGRVIDGSVAVFSQDGSETTIALQSFVLYKTAQGDLPIDISSGDYSVSVRLPDGSEIPIGTFTVDAPQS